MRRLVPLLIVLCGLVAAGAASAAPSDYQNISPYRCPTSTGGFGPAQPVLSASESGGLPVDLHFGWASLRTVQLDKFLAVQNGSVTLTDPSGAVVFSDVWATGATAGWGPYTSTQVTADGTHFYSGWGTRRDEILGPLSNPVPGTDATYHLSMDLELTKAVNDGFGASQPGPWIKITDCPLVVHNYSTP